MCVESTLYFRSKANLVMVDKLYIYMSVIQFIRIVLSTFNLCPPGIFTYRPSFVCYSFPHIVVILASYKEFRVLQLLFLFNSVRRINCRSSLDIWYSAENSSGLELFFFKLVSTLLLFQTHLLWVYLGYWFLGLFLCFS